MHARRQKQVAFNGRVLQNEYKIAEDAKRIAIAGHRRVLEDGRYVCDSERDAEYSDHGEKRSDSEMYTPDMMDENGKLVLGRARMTTEEAKALRAAGRAGGLVTVRALG
jgi:hypothetical protein